MPNARYNLFSLNHRMDQGQTLGVNANAIWLNTGDQQVKFSIKIKTPKGAIYAIYIKIKVADNE